MLLPSVASAIGAISWRLLRSPSSNSLLHTTRRRVIAASLPRQAARLQRLSQQVSWLRAEDRRTALAHRSNKSPVTVARRALVYKHIRTRHAMIVLLHHQQPPRIPTIAHPRAPPRALLTSKLRQPRLQVALAHTELLQLPAQPLHLTPPAHRGSVCCRVPPAPLACRACHHHAPLGGRAHCGTFAIPARTQKSHTARWPSRSGTFVPHITTPTQPSSAVYQTHAAKRQRSAARSRARPVDASLIARCPASRRSSAPSPHAPCHARRSRRACGSRPRASRRCACRGRWSPTRHVPAR